MSKQILNVIKGIVIAFISTIILLLVFSIILTYTNVSEKIITPTIIVITAISIFIGSMIANSKISRNGITNGALIGGMYLLIIYTLSSIINQEFSLTVHSSIMMLIGIICGMFGGILGVNKT